MRVSCVALITVFILGMQCADSQRDERIVVEEGRRLINSTTEKYAKSQQELLQVGNKKNNLDLLKVIQENTRVTMELYSGIKAMAIKYPVVSKKFAENPNLLGRQLGADLRPLFDIVNKLAANIRSKMKAYPDQKSVIAAYKELLLAWVKVLAVFGTELK